MDLTCVIQYFIVHASALTKHSVNLCTATPTRTPFPSPPHFPSPPPFPSPLGERKNACKVDALMTSDTTLRQQHLVISRSSPPSNLKRYWEELEYLSFFPTP